MTKKSFVIKTDENGQEYIIKDVDEMTKNHREHDPEDEGGIICATGRKDCPVNSFKKYLSKLNPKGQTLFQRPKSVSAFVPGVETWYDAQVIGIKSLENFMKRISEDASLSKVYTNHCIRATCITLIKEPKLGISWLSVVTKVKLPDLNTI